MFSARPANEPGPVPPRCPGAVVFISGFLEPWHLALLLTTCPKHAWQIGEGSAARVSRVKWLSEGCHPLDELSVIVPDHSTSGHPRTKKGLPLVPAPHGHPWRGGMPPCPRVAGGVPDGGHLPYVRNQALPSLPADRTRDSVSMVIVNGAREGQAPSASACSCSGTERLCVPLLSLFKALTAQNSKHGNAFVKPCE